MSATKIPFRCNLQHEATMHQPDQLFADQKKPRPDTAHAAAARKRNPRARARASLMVTYTLFR